jgi:hypothetical protein
MIKSSATGVEISNQRKFPRKRMAITEQIKSEILREIDIQNLTFRDK